MMQLMVCPKDTLRKASMHLYMSSSKCRQTSRYDHLWVVNCSQCWLFVIKWFHHLLS